MMQSAFRFTGGCFDDGLVFDALGERSGFAATLHGLGCVESSFIDTAITPYRPTAGAVRLVTFRAPWSNMRVNEPD